MKAWQLVLAGSLGLAAGPPSASPPKPVPDVLRRPGETTLLSFKTARGKTVSLCKGPKAAYLVYRFGTAAKVELQYPAVLDASSWKKFTYSLDFQGGGLANGGRLDAHLAFRNGKVTYELYDTEHAGEGEDGEEAYPREVGIQVSTSAGIIADISGDKSTAQGGIMPNDELRKRATRGENSF